MHLDPITESCQLGKEKTERLMQYKLNSKIATEANQSSFFAPIVISCLCVSYVWLLLWMLFYSVHG